MRRVIYSLYVDIQNAVSHFENKDKFNDNYEWLLDRHKQYAVLCGVEYKHYGYDKQYLEFAEQFGPEISEYNIINFYKIHLMYQLANDFDEILYIDMDVVPVTSDNFFEEHDLSKGVAIMTGTADTQQKINTLNTLRYTHDVRSPMAKWWNTKCLLSEGGYSSEPEVFNTGIVGATATHLKQLNYFDNFFELLDQMKTMIDDDFYPDSIRYMFGYDNETVWGYKTLSQNIPYQQLSKQWHFFMDKWSYIPKDSKLIHCISKDFKYVREWCEKNSV